MRPQLKIVADDSNGNVVLDDVRRDGGAAALFGRNGEINAGSNKELLHAIGQLAKFCETQGVGLESANDAQAKAETQRAHKEMLAAAWDDKEELAALGQHIAAEVQRTAQRDGFMRRLLMQEQIGEGQVVQCRMDKKEVVASEAVGPVKTQPTLVRSDIYYPSEFHIVCNPYIEEKELVRTPGDLLNETYANALTAIMVQEDRTWKTMADDLMGYHNDTLNIADSFLPINLSELTGYILDSGLSPSTCLMSTGFWKDIIALEAWATLMTPESKGEILATGRLGMVYGMEIVSDFFRHPQHKVLEQGEMYVISAPDTHGQYTDRNGVTSLEQDAAHQSIPGRGWHMSELLSMVIVNDRSVAKLNRVGRAFGDNRQLRNNVQGRTETTGYHDATP